MSEHSAESIVHYKDCSRYNWHDPEAQCDGARCHPAQSADPVRAAAEDVLRFGRMISKRTWQLAQQNMMHGLALEGFDEALDVLESALLIDGDAGA